MRFFHATPPAESTVLIAGLSVAAAALAARFAVQAFSGSGNKEGDAAAPSSSASAEGDGKETPSSPQDEKLGRKKTTHAHHSSAAADKTTTGGASAGASSTAGASAASKSHHSMGADFWARQLYSGGFEDKMTRREAALILGVRESADPKRIQDRHRKMLIANHPDVGGSTFLAGKINEAKDVLLKGKGTS